jgi:hypothetical protein
MAMRRMGRIATAALVAIGLTSAGPASAKTGTLARGAMSLVGTPIDIALTPVTASSTFVRKFYLDSKQGPFAKVMLTPLIGGIYGICCTGITGAVAVMRFTDGIVNIPLGLAVLGSDSEPDTALYEPIHGTPGALVDYHGIYFGGYHCEGFFQ